MEWNTLSYAALAAVGMGGVMLWSANKQRTDTGEWGNALQWAYLLLMVGGFGVLSVGLSWSFTAVLLVFTVLTGGVWLWAKISRKQQKNAPNVLDNNHFRDYMSGFFPIIAVVFVVRTFIAEPFQIPSSSMRPNLVKGDFILVNKFAYGIRVPVLNSVLIPTGKVERGDVAVFNYPVQPAVNYIKRIVAVGGDVIEYKNKILTVNGVTEQDDLQGQYRYADDFDPNLNISASRFRAQFNQRQFDVLKDEDDTPSVNMRTLYAYQTKEMPKYQYDTGTNDLRRYCEFDSEGNGFRCTVPEGKYFAMGDNRDNSADSRYWGFVDDHLVVGKAFFIWLNMGDFSRIGSSIQ